MFDLSLPYLPATAAGGKWNNDPGGGGAEQTTPQSKLQARDGERSEGPRSWLPMALEGLANSSHTRC